MTVSAVSAVIDRGGGFGGFTEGDWGLGRLEIEHQLRQFQRTHRFGGFQGQKMHTH